jgi:hypothetical protein
LKDLHHITATPKTFQESEKFVLNLSVYVLTEPEESVLGRRLNCAVANNVSNLDIVFAAEYGRSKLRPHPRLEYAVLLEDSMYAGKIKTFDI